MTPSNASPSANLNQNAPAAAPSTSTLGSVSSPSTSHPLYLRPSSSNPPKSLPATNWRELPRLQLAPPEHQKQPHAQVKQLLFHQQQQQVQQRPQNSTSVLNTTADKSPSASSSRTTSPVLDGEDPSNCNRAGDKRKSASTNPNPKKRRTELPSQQQMMQHKFRQGYALEMHHARAHYPPTASVPTPPPNPQSPTVNADHRPPTAQVSTQTPSTVPNNYFTFNEFQWRLLHLCSEFYEAATELLLSTPPPVLSQAFQLINNGTGTDPISVLNDARRTCDMLLANPQALAVPPPFPASISVSMLNSLLHMNARSVTGPPAPVSTYSPSLPSTVATPPHPLNSAPLTAARTSTDSRPEYEATKNTSGTSSFTNIAQSGQVQGTWKEHETAKLKELAEKYRIRKKVDKASVAVPQRAEKREETEEVEEEEEEDEEEEESSPTIQTDNANYASTDTHNNTPVESTPGDGDTNNTAVSATKKAVKDFDEIDWDQVVAEFGDERSRHQILIKATSLGLKPSSSLSGTKQKRKKKNPASQPFTQFVTNPALPPPTAFTSNASHGTAASPPQIQNLTLALPSTSMAPVPTVCTSSASPRNIPRVPVGTLPVHSMVPALGLGYTTPRPRMSDKTASSSDPAERNVKTVTTTANVSNLAATKSKGRSTNTLVAIAPSTGATVASSSAFPTPGGISNVSGYGVPPTWGYPPPPAAMSQSGVAQGAGPYYPYAGMYYPQGYPLQNYSIPSAAPVPGASAPPPGPPPLFVQTHPHFNPRATPHAHPHAPPGQTFYAYVPRTEDNAPKKMKKNGRGGTVMARAAAESASSTVVVPNTGLVSQKATSVQNVRTATDRSTSATPGAVTPKISAGSTAAEAQLPV